MRVLLTATMAASVLAIGLNVEPAQSRPLGWSSASPETAVQKVQQTQEIDRERARARLRQRAGERIDEMSPAERQRAKRRVQQRLEERGFGYTDRERAKARARERLRAQ